MADGTYTTTGTGTGRGIAAEATVKPPRAGLPPPPCSLEEALRRVPGRSRRSTLRTTFHRKYTLAVFSALTEAGQRAVFAALTFCWDSTAVEDLVAAEVMRDLDPRRAAQCVRVAHGRGLEYDHTNPTHRARVACAWVRRQHHTRARSGARE